MNSQRQYNQQNQQNHNYNNNRVEIPESLEDLLEMSVFELRKLQIKIEAGMIEIDSKVRVKEWEMKANPQWDSEDEEWENNKAEKQREEDQARISRLEGARMSYNRGLERVRIVLLTKREEDRSRQEKQALQATFYKLAKENLPSEQFDKLHALTLDVVHFDNDEAAA